MSLMLAKKKLLMKQERLPPSFRAASSAIGSGGATSIVLNRPSGLQDGDLLVAVLSNAYGASHSVTPPAGWTTVVRSSAGFGMYVCTKVAASEPASFTFNFPTGYISAALLAYDHAEAADVVGSLAAGTNHASVAPAITLPRAGQLICCSGVNTTRPGFTPPPGMVERARTGDGSVGSIALSDEPRAAGASGDRTAMWGGTGTYEFYSLLVAIS